MIHQAYSAKFTWHLAVSFYFSVGIKIWDTNGWSFNFIHKKLCTDSEKTESFIFKLKNKNKNASTKHGTRKSLVLKMRLKILVAFPATKVNLLYLNEWMDWTGWLTDWLAAWMNEWMNVDSQRMRKCTLNIK